MHVEIERKFLVADYSYRDFAFDAIRIKQGYLCLQKGKSIRVRIANDRAYITVKGPSANGGLTRFEWEKEIDVADAEELLQLCEGAYIDKIRYKVQSGSHVVEVDEFLGQNAPLVVAEIELRSEGEPYDKPAFLAGEVTGQPQYNNSFLSLHPYSTWMGEKG